ncbi:hypothetical protein TWF506_005601 [Arthrobotrys conoides]|uniref:Uncharacterized protein n=1 Tax=Arthrobotrys conoides TaxID=74498 RepID=A0AAN8P727_9PEZI
MPPVTPPLYLRVSISSILPSYITSAPYLQVTTDHLDNYDLRQANPAYTFDRRDNTRDVPIGEYWLWRIGLMIMFVWVFGAMCVGSWILGRKRRREEENEKVDITGLNARHRLRSFGYKIPYAQRQVAKQDKAYQRYRRILLRKLTKKKGEWLRKRAEAQKDAAHSEELKKALEKELKRKDAKLKKLKPLRTPIPWDNYDDPPAITMGNEREEFDTMVPMPRDRRQTAVDKARRQSVFIQQEDQIKNARKQSSTGQPADLAKTKFKSTGLKDGDGEEDAGKVPKFKDIESSKWKIIDDQIPPPWQWILEADPWLRNVLRKAEVVNGLYHYAAPPPYPPPGFLEEVVERASHQPTKEVKKKKAQAVPWGEMRGRHAFMPDTPAFAEYEHPWDEYAGDIDVVMRPLNLKELLWKNEATRLQRGRLIYYDDQWKEVAARKGFGVPTIKYYKKGARPRPVKMTQDGQLPSRPMMRGPGGLFLPDDQTFREIGEVEEVPVSPTTEIPGVTPMLNVDPPGESSSEGVQGQENKPPWKNRLGRMAKFFG